MRQNSITFSIPLLQFSKSLVLTYFRMHTETKHSKFFWQYISYFTYLYKKLWLENFWDAKFSPSIYSIITKEGWKHKLQD